MQTQLPAQRVFTTLKLSQITIDAGTQIRDHTDDQVVADYADLIKAGTVFPPLKLVFDGARWYLTDGFHRYFAYRLVGGESDLDIKVEITNGTRADAVREALGANATHGLMRTSADKRKAVLVCIREFPSLSNREISRTCAVSTFLVNEIRKEVEGVRDSLTITKDTVLPPEEARKQILARVDVTKAQISALRESGSDEDMDKAEELESNLEIALAVVADDSLHDQAEKEKADEQIKEVKSEVVKKVEAKEAAVAELASKAAAESDAEAKAKAEAAAAAARKELDELKAQLAGIANVVTAASSAAKALMLQARQDSVKLHRLSKALVAEPDAKTRTKLLAEARAIEAHWAKYNRLILGLTT